MHDQGLVDARAEDQRGQDRVEPQGYCVERHLQHPDILFPPRRRLNSIPDAYQPLQCTAMPVELDPLWPVS
jgi:hypothetical protein